MKNYFKFTLLFLSALAITISSCRPPVLETAVMEFKNKRYDNAREKAFETTQKFPEHAEGWWYYGITSIETAKSFDDYKAGNHALLKAKELDPKGYEKKVDDYRYSTYGRNFNKSVGLFNQSSNFSGDSLTATVKKSIEKAEIAALFNTKNYKIYNIIARNYSNLGDMEKAGEYYKKEYDTAPDSLQTEFDYGYYLFAQNKDYENAVTYLEQIVNNPRTDATAKAYQKDSYLLLSQSFQILGKKDMAVKYYVQAIEKNDDNSALPYNLALIFYQDKKYADAAKYFEMAAVRGYENADAYTFAGNSLNLTENFEKAAKVMKEGLELFPDSGQMWSEYAKSLARLNKAKEAKAALKKAKKLGIE